MEYSGSDDCMNSNILDLQASPKSFQLIQIIDTKTDNSSAGTLANKTFSNSMQREFCGYMIPLGKTCKRKGNCPFHKKNSTTPRKKKKGWSKEEHHRFLIGLQIHGRGKWKAISNYVMTKNAVQVQSHGQKYFERLKKAYKTKNSINDITLPNLVTDEQEKELKHRPKNTAKTEETFSPNYMPSNGEYNTHEKDMMKCLDWDASVFFDETFTNYDEQIFLNGDLIFENLFSQDYSSSTDESSPCSIGVFFEEY